MRAFDDICVRPGFEDEGTLRGYKRTALQTTLLVGFVLTVTAVSTGNVPGVDAYVLFCSCISKAVRLTVALGAACVTS